MALAPAAAIARGPAVEVTFVGDVMVVETPGELIERGVDPLAGVSKYLGPRRLRVANFLPRASALDPLAREVRT